jgi:hypothetical protein
MYDQLKSLINTMNHTYNKQGWWTTGGEKGKNNNL